MRFFAPILGQGFGFPLTHGGMSQDMIDPALPLANVQPIGADAESNRGIERVGCGKVSTRQPWTAKSCQAGFEQFAHPLYIAAQALAHRLGGDAHADVHRAIVAQMAEPAVHFTDCPLREDAGLFLCGPDTLMPLPQVQGNGKGVRNRPVAMDQHRHLTGGGKFAEVLVIVGLGKWLEPFREGNAERLHQQPGTQRPAGVVPVCGDQGVSHVCTL